MKTAFIINPVAGKGSGKRFYDKIKDLPLIINNSIDFYLTKKPLDALEIAKNICNDYDRIIIGGGDGTLHEAINGLDVNSSAILGLIPIGSGNDFSLSFHNNNVKPLELLEYYLSNNPSIRSVDFGLIKITDSKGKIFNRRMINSFGVGFDAKVAFYNQRNKTFSGTMSYIYSILKAIFEFRKIDVKANLNGKSLEQNALFCAVGNGKTIGGGLYLMPHAIVDDNLLNLSIVTIKSRFRLLLLFPKALSNKLSGRKELSEHTFNDLDLELKTPFYAHIDGEIISDNAKLINVKLSAEKFNFMCIN
ncbi:MAG: diacylglycerol kinase family lipid kinase [Melioribacteraceae bacterium]|nr:diacylglycerol kinase family lipid kinase [Melioribacteraceae bacterium]